MAQPSSDDRRPSRHLDARALARLATLQLRVSAVVDGTLAGMHRSPHRGSSVEFAEHKEYSPGDDLRRLDWKAYAKFDRYYVRQYEDETELKAYLVLDGSGSMGYGAPLSKLAYGSVLVGSLAYLLARQRDQPGLVAFADGVVDYVPPRGGTGHVAQVLATLDGLRPQGETDLGRAVRYLTERLARRALVVVVSDLFDPRPDALDLLRRLRAHRHRVVLFHLLHDDELTLPFSDVTIFQSMESDHEELVDPAGVRSAYLKQMDGFLARTRAACREGEIGYQLVRPSDPVDRVLLELFGGQIQGAA